MGNEIVQANYPDLEGIASQFGSLNEAASAMQAQIRGAFEPLQGGGWVGRGSDAFMAEMDSEMFPAIERMIQALEAGRAVTIEISNLMRQAEEEAASIYSNGDPFGGGASGGGAGGTGGGGAGGGATMGVASASVGAGGTSTQNGGMLGNTATNMQQLIQQIAELGASKTPVGIVQVGPNEYLVMLAGTEVGEGSNNWGSAIQSGLGNPSSYQKAVRDIITQNLPPGAQVHLAGHSLGGIVANNLADNQDFLDQYNVQSVTTFGSPVSDHANPNVQYTRFADPTDPVPFLTRDLIQGQFPGETQTRVETGETFITAHSAYKDTDSLGQIGLPFDSNGWGEPMRFEAPQMDGTARVVDNILSGDPGRIASGVIHAPAELSRNLVVSGVDYAVGEVTENLPAPIRNGIDRYVDRFQERATSGQANVLTGGLGNIVVAGGQTLIDAGGDLARGTGNFIRGLFD